MVGSREKVKMNEAFLQVLEDMSIINDLLQQSEEFTIHGY